MNDRAPPQGESAANGEFAHSRSIDAPREEVFSTRVDPVHRPDGTDYPNESVFLEVVAPERVARFVPEATERSLARLAREARSVR